MVRSRLSLNPTGWWKTGLGSRMAKLERFRMKKSIECGRARVANTEGVSWRWASASVTGTSHISRGSALQDAYKIQTVSKSCLLAFVSDGAGSANLSRYGAWLNCRLLSCRIREFVQVKQELPTEEKLRDWFDELRDKIATIATRKNIVPGQFAATFAGVIACGDRVLTFSVGDSGAVGRRRGEWEVLCVPETGEYASTTYFVTDDPQPALHVRLHENEYDAFALFSDGVGDIALASNGTKAHAPFFVPMIAPIDAAVDEGRLTELSNKLRRYLASPAVCARTDDDKTLILVSRAHY